MHSQSILDIQRLFQGGLPLRHSSCVNVPMLNFQVQNLPPGNSLKLGPLQKIIGVLKEGADIY